MAMILLTIETEPEESIVISKEIFNLLQNTMDELCAKCIDDGKEYLADILEQYRICLEL